MVKIKIRIRPALGDSRAALAFPPHTGDAMSPESLLTDSQGGTPASIPPQTPNFEASLPIMAPATPSDQKVVEDQIKSVIQDLYHIMVQVTSYDQTSTLPSKDVLERSIKELDASLKKVYTTASNPNTNLPTLPPEVVQYVDSGRNPDIYTREFVEGTRRSNQLIKGKVEAFADFRDILAAEMAKAMPELREDIGRVLEQTGGKRNVKLEDDA